MPLKFALEAEITPTEGTAPATVVAIADAQGDDVQACALPVCPLPPDPALLAQFRAAMEMFEHYSLEHDKINERVQNGVQYLRDNLKDEQSKKWVDEVQTWPAGGIAQGTTFDALAHRVKVNQPALSAILQHWRDLLRQRETQRQHAEWEAFAQHDIEKTLRAQTGQSSGTVCVNCWQWIAEVYGEHHAACRGWKSDGE